MRSSGYPARPIARQERSTVVSDVWPLQATAVMELSEMPAGSASTTSATRLSAGRRLGNTPRTLINTDADGRGSERAAPRGVLTSWSCLSAIPPRAYLRLDHRDVV